MAKLIGAVAMAFPFSKDPIAGIRPIEDMVRSSPAAAPASRKQLALAERDVTRSIPRPEPAMAGDARMIDIATPISFGGFTRGHARCLRAAVERAGSRTPSRHLGRADSGTEDGQSGRRQARLDDQRATHGRRYGRRRRRHRHLHRWLARLRLRPPLPRYRRDSAALRARRSDHTAAQRQHVIQALYRA